MYTGYPRTCIFVGAKLRQGFINAKNKKNPKKKNKPTLLWETCLQNKWANEVLIIICTVVPSSDHKILPLNLSNNANTGVKHW